MKLCCTSWSFPALTLPEIVGLARVLGFPAIDIGLFYRSALDRQRVLSDPQGYATELRQLGMRFSNIYWLFGGDLAERNLATAAGRAANRADLERVVQFCQAASIPSIMILPGIVNPGQSRNQAIAESIVSLRELVPVAEAGRVKLAIEPHVHSLAESPGVVEQILAAVPGLGLVLDYAHFVCLGYRQEEIDPLARSAVHIHLRQARAGALQSKLALGTINFAALIGQLREVGYQGYLAVEYVHQEYMGTLHDDVLTETVQMRDLVRQQFERGGA
ncbi:MAG: hypothetical protein Fur005_42700 [Roseiflexaceae bacterium]